MRSDTKQDDQTKKQNKDPLRCRHMTCMLSAAELIKKTEASRAVVLLLDEAYELGVRSSKPSDKPSVADMHKILMDTHRPPSKHTFHK